MRITVGMSYIIYIDQSYVYTHIEIDGDNQKKEADNKVIIPHNREWQPCRKEAEQLVVIFGNNLGDNNH